MEDPTFRLLGMAYSQERHVYSGVLGIPSEVVVDGEEAAHASFFPEERIVMYIWSSTGTPVKTAG
jgi:hypothetical protein